MGKGRAPWAHEIGLIVTIHHYQTPVEYIEVRSLGAVVNCVSQTGAKVAHGPLTGMRGTSTFAKHVAGVEANLS